ncbi:MAG: sigma 54-interacting transcriptional regulator [Deltaproteobacteria bacterium]|nr:sigma 54-interacting transcriptional regulator [Deltaproteobacteria bacterium]
MTASGTQSRLDAIDDASLWRGVAEGTAGETGSEFFAHLTRSLSQTIRTFGAWVTEWRPVERRLHSYSMYLDNAFVEDFNYDVAGTPCERVVEHKGSLIHIEDNIIDLYPQNQVVQATRAVSFMGIALVDLDDTVLGHLAVLDTKPMPADVRLEALFRVFSLRATSELRRLRAKRAIAAREAQLARLIDGAMDAIVELDAHLAITHANRSAESVFGAAARDLEGQAFSRFLNEESTTKLRGLARALDASPAGKRASWVAGGLTSRTVDGSPFPAEATLSRSPDTEGAVHYTLVLRNVNERTEAERAIEALSSEAEYLRSLRSPGGRPSQMIGESPAFVSMRQKIEEVAPTDATVLVTGETGTGKELVADALHALSPRKGKRIIKINCGAIPENLIESEFFGHEAGAYTGATRAREGRFTLADEGTLFLDEIGELPLALQPKLLRILQSGAFEPVGSSKTRRVNVRVVAATHRNLAEDVKAGRFREDLYYRLAVFPIEVPPLRCRRDDVPRLARVLIKQIAARMGKTLEPLSDFALDQLSLYEWPGNVRELVNVLERAVITARNGLIDLHGALPEISAPRATPTPIVSDAESGSASESSSLSEWGEAPRILTFDELREFEKKNFERALHRASGIIAGPSGAAALLGMKPSTMRSRLIALGIK